ncbi:MAG: tetratricopeptide repeat protein, partial [Planctomycetota bacterium]
MPQTINGIGTIYYGKSNLVERHGVCESCNGEVRLRSYDTRLWFVVLFIPIFPLGKKRIIDFCPTCTTHRALNLNAWRGVRRTALAEGMKAMAAAPDDPEPVMELHHSCLLFNESEKAAQLREILETEFADNAKVQQHLGDALAHLGRGEEAERHHARAQEIDPELPRARDTAAVKLLEEGKLDEAREMLSHAEADRNLLLALACAYQENTRHEEALQLFRKVQNGFPAVVLDRKFRSLVRTSEAALGRTKSQIPPAEGPGGFLLKASVALVLAFAALAGYSYYVSKNRTLHIVNGYSAPATVEIEGVETFTVPGKGRITAKVSEGTHAVHVSGPAAAEQSFTIESGFFNRLFDGRVFILNAASSALLLHERVAYSVSPGAGAPDGTFSLLYGKPFYALPDLDYVFEPYPDEITLPEGKSMVWKQGIDIVTEEMPDIFLSLIEAEQTDKALGVAEWHLESRDAELDFLSTYVATACGIDRRDRVRSFLRKLCRRRPVDIDVHRAYQDLRTNRAEWEALVAEYDALLKADPSGSALLYLRARLCTSVREAMSFLEKAVQADPANAHAHHAIGWNHSSRGEWREAHAAANEACRIAPDHDHFRAQRMMTGMAAGELEAVEKELRRCLEEAPMSNRDTALLADCLTAAGRPDEARKLCEDYRSRFLEKAGEDVRNTCRDLLASVYYSIEDFAALEQLVAGADDPGANRVRFVALVEQG